MILQDLIERTQVDLAHRACPTDSQNVIYSSIEWRLALEGTTTQEHIVSTGGLVKDSRHPALKLLDSDGAMELAVHISLDLFKYEDSAT